MNVKNYVRFEFKSLAENVSFARSCVAAFASQLDLTLEEIEEIKVVLSEAVSNSIIHAYDNECSEKIVVLVSITDDRSLEIAVEDHGKGIEDVEKAMEPAFSSDSSRAGLGFTFMKSFMDEIEVFSRPGEGTTVRLKRCFGKKEQEAYA